MAAALLYLVVVSVKQPPPLVALSMSQCMRHAGMETCDAENPTAQRRVHRLVTKLELKRVLSHVEDLSRGRLPLDCPSPVIMQKQPRYDHKPYPVIAQDHHVNDCTAGTQDQTISDAILQEESSTNDSISYISDLTSPTASFSHSSSSSQLSQASFQRTDVLKDLLSQRRPKERALITGFPGISGKNVATSLSSSKPSLSDGTSTAAPLLGSTLRSLAVKRARPLKKANTGRPVVYLTAKQRKVINTEKAAARRRVDEIEKLASQRYVEQRVNDVTAQQVSDAIFEETGVQIMARQIRKLANVGYAGKTP
jgi:hypothetical protein